MNHTTKVIRHDGAHRGSRYDSMALCTCGWSTEPVCLTETEAEEQAEDHKAATGSVSTIRRG